jgi:hypothetical protein
MSGFTGRLRSNTDRAARVQRLNSAVAERQQKRERREAGKKASREDAVRVHQNRRNS